MLSAAEFENASSRNRAEPVAIWKARKFIEEHSREELSLTKVAKAVGMNANHLSESFKQVTGINFVEYVAFLASNLPVTSCETQICAPVKSRSLQVFNHCRNSTAFSKSFRANRRQNTVRPKASDADIRRSP